MANNNTPAATKPTTEKVAATAGLFCRKGVPSAVSVGVTAELVVEDDRLGGV